MGKRKRGKTQAAPPRQAPSELADIPENTPIARVEGGRFAPGVSANPAGKPAGVAAFRLKARVKVDELVIDAWVAEIQGRGPDWMKASELLTAYAYGRPVVAVSGPDEGPIPVAVAAQVNHVDPARAVRLVQLLAALGVRPVGFGGPGEGDDAEGNEVHGAGADGSTGAVPPR